MSYQTFNLDYKIVPSKDTLAFVLLDIFTAKIDEIIQNVWRITSIYPSF